MRERIRVVIADDHPVVREGLAAILNTETDIDLVGQAVDGEECVKKARELRPDLVVLDLVMANKSGLAAIREIVAEQPNVRFLVLTDLADDEQVYLAVKAGALGFLLKDAATCQLVDAIRSVYHGTSVLPFGLAQWILGNSRRLPGVDQLTARELEVLRHIAAGLHNKEIAKRLDITEQTVLSHVRNIFRKLGLGNRTEAALYAAKHGLD